MKKLKISAPAWLLLILFACITDEPQPQLDFGEVGDGTLGEKIEFIRSETFHIIYQINKIIFF